MRSKHRGGLSDRAQNAAQNQLVVIAIFVLATRSEILITLGLR
jgi:hypothetical protein